MKTLRWPPDVVFGRARLLEAGETILQEGSVTRLKGLFRTDEGWTRLELAGGRRHEGSTNWRRDSRVDAIIDTHATYTEVVHHALTDAILSESERSAAANSVEVGLPDGTSKRFDRTALGALPNGVDDVSELLPGRTGAAARMEELLAAVGVSEGVNAVVVASDGFTTEPVPVEALRTGLLIHSIADEALPAGKGGPIRLMIPGDAGPGGPCANVKSVVRIALRST